MLALWNRARWSLRQCEVEGRALAQCAFNPELASVAFHRLSGDRQPRTRSATELVGRVESLEERKDPVVISGIDADAIVRHGKLPHWGFGQVGLRLVEIR